MEQNWSMFFEVTAQVPEWVKRVVVQNSQWGRSMALLLFIVIVAALFNVFLSLSRERITKDLHEMLRLKRPEQVSKVVVLP